MARCPHCGEPVDKGQERCFACGQKVHARLHRGERPLNPAIFVFAGALVLAGIIGIIIVSASRSRRARQEVRHQQQARAQDSIREAKRARRDTAKAAARSEELQRQTEELDKLDLRFGLVQQQAVKGQPSPEQAKLISQIRTEMGRLRQLATFLSVEPRPKPDTIKDKLREGERAVRNLISDLSRAPKQKAGAGREGSR
jgi:predicted  nucleic acid-binding Zn-ribbon protein